MINPRLGARDTSKIPRELFMLPLLSQPTPRALDEKDERRVRVNLKRPQTAFDAGSLSRRNRRRKHALPI
jgi:hypothetical protein